MAKKEQAKGRWYAVVKKYKAKAKQYFDKVWDGEKYKFKNTLINFAFVFASYCSRIFKYIWFSILVLFSYTMLVSVLTIALNKTMFKNFDYIIFPISGLIVACVLLSMWDIVIKYLGKGK